MIERADAGLGGILFIVAVIVAQVVNALRRGTPPVPTIPTPAPARSYTPSAKMREIWEEPVVVPVPAAVPAPDVDDMARRLQEAEAALSAPAAGPHAWARLGVHGREDWQKALILSEVLQPPVALR